MPIPDTLYAMAGNTAIAYQVYGSGENRVVAVPGVISHVELFWEWIPNHYVFERWGKFATVAHFDKRGTGSSDRIAGAASIEDRMEDFRVVMDTVGWERATIWGLSEGGAAACLFAATYPERTERLILQGAFARLVQGPDYDIGYERAAFDSMCTQWAANWGTPETFTVPFFSPSQIGDEEYLRFLNRVERMSSTPANLLAMISQIADFDIRHVLPTIRVPTLVVHARQDLVVPIEHGRYLAAHIPGARLVEYDGEHFPVLAGVDGSVDAIEEFVVGAVTSTGSDRVLATVLFTDICDSTARAETLGDEKWKALLDRHDNAMRTALARHGGTEVNTTGDGLLTTFDSPTRALRCAKDMIDAGRATGLDIRVGVHTGEIERRGRDVAGIAVHIGARVAALAGPGEVMVSGAVPPLVVGSELAFTDKGDVDLKGVTGAWRLFALEI